MQLKLPQKEQFKKTAEGTGNLINNKTADAVTKTQTVELQVSSTSPQNILETVKNEHDKVIPSK